MNQSSKFGLSDRDLTKITDLLRSVSDIQLAKIFGSRAKGNYREGSDIDIAIEAPTMDHTQYLRLRTKLDDLMLPYKIDLVVMHQIDNEALIEHITRVGVRLW